MRTQILEVNTEHILPLTSPIGLPTSSHLHNRARLISIQILFHVSFLGNSPALDFVLASAIGTRDGLYLAK